VISPVTVSVGSLSIITTLHAQDYIEGTPSVTNYISIEAPPPDSITITPYSAYATFNPTQLYFNSSTGTTLGFTVTPVAFYTGTLSIGFALSGPSASYYTAPAGYSTTAVIRSFQIYPDPSSYWAYADYPSGPFTASINVAPTTNFSVNLAGQFLDFSPQVLTFTPKVTALTFTFTPTADVYTYLQPLFSGTDASLYAQPADYEIFVTARTLTPYFLTNYTYVPIGYQIKLEVVATPAPNDNVQLIPINPNLIFSPSTVTFGTGNKVQNLVISGNYAGVHVVRFQIAGTDAGLYATVPDLTVIIDQGAPAEPANFLNGGGRLTHGFVSLLIATCVIALIF